MLKNNNREIIKKLSNRSLKVNKMRNIFAILAIALTTLLITTTIVGGITFYNTNKVYTNVSSYGVDADGYIDFNIKNIDKLNNIDNIKKKGIIQLASTDIIQNEVLLAENVCLFSTDDKDVYEMMAVVPIEGTYPKKANDILLPSWVLDVLNMDKNIGETVSLDIVINNEVKSIDFNLCGYYESLVVRGTGTIRAFVSNEFIPKYNKGITEIEGTTAVFLTLKNINSNSSYDTVQDELNKISNKIDGTKAKAHPKYDSEKSISSDSEIQQFIAIAVGIVLIIATGYLIIYNIFYISVSKDIKFYGLLKTIGTTSKQLKRIIIRQALKLSIIGIPIGLVLGYAVATFIIPMALSFTFMGNIVVVSKSPLNFILSILFSLVTVLISCNKPGRIAGKVSPIEAVRFVSSDAENLKKKNKKGTNGAKLNKMAWSNIVKNKKRVMLSVLSISLSAVIVIFTISATLGIDPEAHAENEVVADITISNVIGNFWGKVEYQAITEDLINKVKELDIVKDARINYKAITPDEDGIIYDFGVEFVLSGKLKEEVKRGIESGNQNIRTTMLGFADDMMIANLTALKADRLDKELEKFKVIDGKIDEEEFKKGDYIIYNVGVGESYVIEAGDILPLTVKIPDENGVLKEVTKEFKVMAVVADNTGGFSASNMTELNIEENAFKELFPDYNNYIKSIDIDLKDNVDLAEADEEIQKIINESGNIMLFLGSKNFYIDAMEEMKLIVSLIGGTVALILGFIGIINVINTMLTSIISRKLEFSMLESIGMTNSQSKKMILFEGMYYIILTAVLVIPLGLVASVLAPMMFPIYGGFKIGIYLVSVIVAMSIISIIMLTVPLMGYRNISKESIVERLRIAE